MRRLGFTLMEVNLAMFIMATGTLGLIGLYSFGYRENQQSNEDVQAAAVAQMHLNAMVAALSSTNMTWDAWQGIGIQPSKGWGEYAGDDTDSGFSPNDGLDQARPPNREGCNGVARSVFNMVVGAPESEFSASFDPQNLAVGIVVTPGRGGRTYSVAVRCGRRAATLVYQPLYYSEVYFQGLIPENDPKK